MRLSPVLGLALTLLTEVGIAAPLDGDVASILGSKANLLLATCRRNEDGWDEECPSIIFCDDKVKNVMAETFTVVAYYANGSSGSNKRPTQIAKVNEPARAWEGATRSGRLGGSRTFSATISADAKGASAGGIAGDAKVSNEPFICFKDGKTKFSGRDEELLGLGDSYDCTADYWCGSIEV